MTRKAITLEFVVATVLAIGLGILQSIGAVYLKEKYLAPSTRRKPLTASPTAADC